MKTQDSGEIDHNLKLIAKSSIFIFLMLLFSKIFSYFYRIVIARYFGPEIYGIFSLATIILALFVIFSSAGLSEGVLRFIPIYRGKKEKEKIKYTFHFVSKLLFVFSLIVAIFLFFTSKTIALDIFKEPGLEIFLKIFSFFVPIWVFGTLFLFVLRSFEKVKTSSFVDYFLQNFVKITLLLILIFLGFKEGAIIFSYGIGIFIFFLSSLFFSRKYFPFIFKKVNLGKKYKKIISKKILNYSIPTMFFGIFGVVLYWIDSFSLGIFKGSASVGFYNSVIPIVLLLDFVPVLFSQLFFPIMMKDYSQNKYEIIKQTSKQISKWIFVINLPIFLVFLFFPGAIINLLFGSEYLVAANALRILAFGGFIATVLSISRHLLLMKGKSKVILVTTILAVFLNIFLNVTLIPKPSIFGLDNSLGLIGAAVATMVSIIFLNLLLFAEAIYYTSIIPLKRKIINITLISIIPFAIVLWIRNTIQITSLGAIILGTFFFLMYFCLILIFKGFDKNDLRILNSIKDKFLGK